MDQKWQLRLSYCLKKSISNKNCFFFIKESKFSFIITGINYMLNYIKIETVILNYNNISQYNCVSDRPNAALLSIRHFYEKHQKLLLNSTCVYYVFGNSAVHWKEAFKTVLKWMCFMWCSKVEILSELPVSSRHSQHILRLVSTLFKSNCLQHTKPLT